MVKLKPQEVINSATPDVQRIVESILQIEQEYQHFQNVDSNSDVRKEIESKILKVIDKAVSSET